MEIKTNKTLFYELRDIQRWWALECPACGWRGLERDAIKVENRIDPICCPKCIEKGYEEPLDEDLNYKIIGEENE